VARPGVRAVARRTREAAVAGSLLTPAATRPPLTGQCRSARHPVLQSCQAYDPDKDSRFQDVCILIASMTPVDEDALLVVVV
jgi:hypothetical protein